MRFRRRYRSRSRSGTVSSVVKLTYELGFDPRGTGAYQGLWVPVTVIPSDIPGFLDYNAVYSKFRIKKCVLMINRTETTSLNYLVVPSRAFAEHSVITGNTVGQPYNNVPPQGEQALRQTKWQKEFFPSTVSGKVRVAWHPYTTVSSFGPNTAQTASRLFQKVWNLNRWTPMAWVQTASTGTPTPFVTFGPYIVPNDAETNDAPAAGAYPIKSVLTLYCQFAGQT